MQAIEDVAAEQPLSEADLAFVRDRANALLHTASESLADVGETQRRRCPNRAHSCHKLPLHRHFAHSERTSANVHGKIAYSRACEGWLPLQSGTCA